MGGFIMKEDKKYKRILVVNDDISEEEFVEKYKKLEEWKEDIVYCGNTNDAMIYLEDDEMFCCDKILLDIKIEWNVDDKYCGRIKKHIDIKNMQNEYGGFILFMYLIARGFPVERIAFLSAYIVEEDSEKEKKESILKFLEEQKFRKSDIDSQLKSLIDKVPSQKSNMLRILESKEYKPRELTPYAEIANLLRKDVSQSINIETVLDDRDAARAFFDKISATGLIVSNKINKGNTEKLATWVKNLEEIELERYYIFRGAAINICNDLVNYYNDIDKELKAIEKQSLKMEDSWKKIPIEENIRKKAISKIKEKGIYRCVGNNQQLADMLTKYPPQYFIEILKRIKDMLILNVTTIQLSDISDSVINTMISYWEGLNESRDQDNASLEKIKNYSATMVLKFTRNWKMHNLIDKVDFDFMSFIFTITVYLMGSESSELVKIIGQVVKGNTINEKELLGYDEALYKDINEKLNRKVYIINLSKLFGEYGRDSLTKFNIGMKDIYKIFYLCLHSPKVEDNDVVFRSGESWINDEVWQTLEALALVNIQKSLNQNCFHG